MKYIFTYKVVTEKTIVVNSHKSVDCIWDEYTKKHEGYTIDSQGDEILDESHKLYDATNTLLAQW